MKDTIRTDNLLDLTISQIHVSDGERTERKAVSE